MANISDTHAYGGEVTISEGVGEVYDPQSDTYYDLEAGDRFEVAPDGSGEVYVGDDSHYVSAGSEINLLQGEGVFVPVDAEGNWRDDQPVPLTAGDSFVPPPAPQSRNNIAETHAYGGEVSITEGFGEVYVPAEDTYHTLGPGDRIELAPDGSGEMVIDGEASYVPAGTEVSILDGGSGVFTPVDAEGNWRSDQPVPLTTGDDFVPQTAPQSTNLAEEHSYGGEISIREGYGEVYVPSQDTYYTLEPGDRFEIAPDGSGEVFVGGDSVFVPAGTEASVSQGHGVFTPADATGNYLDGKAVLVMPGDGFVPPESRASLASPEAQRIASLNLDEIRIAAQGAGISGATLEDMDFKSPGAGGVSQSQVAGINV